MQFDFTAINGSTALNVTMTAPQNRQELLKEPEGKISSLNIKTATEPARGLLARHKKMSADAERARLVYKEYAENIRQSEQTRAEIIKDIRAGAEPADTLLKACKVITLMTGDRAFYSTVERTLKGS